MSQQRLLFGKPVEYFKKHPVTNKWVQVLRSGNFGLRGPNIDRFPHIARPATRTFVSIQDKQAELNRIDSEIAKLKSLRPTMSRIEYKEISKQINHYHPYRTRIRIALETQIRNETNV